MSVFSLAQDLVHEVTKENNLEKTVGGFLVPERVWRVASALVVTWVDVLGVDNVLVGLWKLGNSGGELVDVWGDEGSELVENWVVEESNWDEEFLPGESPSDLDKHTDESHTEFFGVFVGNLDVGDGSAELWKEVLINELGRGLIWDEDSAQFRDKELGNEPWEHKGESGSDQSSESDVVNVREIGVIKELSPLWNLFLGEHFD